MIKKEALIGFWKMMPSPNLAANKINPWTLPYQWFGFYEDGRAYSYMSSHDGNYTSQKLANLFEILPSNAPTYEINGNFIIIENPEIENYQEVWGITFMEDDLNDAIKKGDLVMSLDDGNGNPVYFRLLRKILV